MALIHSKTDKLSFYLRNKKPKQDDVCARLHFLRDQLIDQTELWKIIHFNVILIFLDYNWISTIDWILVSIFAALLHNCF